MPIQQNSESPKILLISSYAGDTRTAVLQEGKLVDLLYEKKNQKGVKGNVYLAKITRVEPSLQAAFVDYGANKNGFLPFDEIHPDYYLLPQEDKERLMGSQDKPLDAKRKQHILQELGRKYTIQEVIKGNQLVLVQVAKDAKGSKGASLTTYLSLPGRYCVLMPNSFSAGGISKKIHDPEAREQLRSFLESLDIPSGVSIIMRTAGVGKPTKVLQGDVEYVRGLWDEIRKKTLESTAPSLIHEEADPLLVAVRDLTGDRDEIYVEGDFSEKSEPLQQLFQPKGPKIIKHQDTNTLLFQKFGVEEKIADLVNPRVALPSGGYIVIQPTEALVSIDVNSGSATRSRHIEKTALQTNLEAAREIAIQVRLRNLSGLLVVDFIDMEDASNNQKVEQLMRELLAQDRAKTFVGRISHFGLLEFSRQRLQNSLFDLLSHVCETCHGYGAVPNEDLLGLSALRVLEAKLRENREPKFSVHGHIALLRALINGRIQTIADLEKKHNVRLSFVVDNQRPATDYSLVRRSVRKGKVGHAARGRKEMQIPAVKGLAIKPVPIQKQKQKQKQKSKKGFFSRLFS